MRILHITTFLQGGAGRVISSLARRQKEGGHDVRVVVDAGGEPGYENYTEYLDSLTAAKVPLVSLHSTFKRDLALNASAAHALKALLHEWKPEVVHAHAAIPAVVARLAGIAGHTGVPVIHTMHGWGTAKDAAQATADLAVLELADAIVTPAHASRRALLDLGLSASVKVIPYGIDDRALEGQPDAEDLAILERLGRADERALCVGTIGARKNQRLLVEALTQPEMKAATAVFIGDGDSQVLLDDAQRLGVAHRIAILGYRPNASRYLAGCRALVLPSRNEGLPLSILEAFRAGVPIVASHIPELAEALEDGDAGYLFERESVPGLASALRTAFDADAQARAANLKTLFATRYTITHMLQAYEQVYRACRDTKSSPTAVPFRDPF